MMVVFSYPLGDGAELGPLEPWHAEQFAAAVEQARDHLAPWVPFAHTVTDVGSAGRFLQRFADEHARDTGHIFGIWKYDRLVGGAILPLFDTKNSVCELGVWLTPEVQGRGLVTRAARRIFDWAISVRGMCRVEWHTDPHNARSRAVARRLGMTREGVRRSAFVVAGVRQDSEIWAVLARDWPTVTPPAAAAKRSSRGGPARPRGSQRQ